MKKANVKINFYNRWQMSDLHEIQKIQKKTKLKPFVGFSLLKDFSDVVAVDLKPTNSIHILLIIDHAT